MPTSSSQTATLTCPDCGHTFDAQIWLIVDAAERPDLLDRARTGTLLDIPCPHCGHTGQVDAPLLIFLPDDEPHLTFSPAEQTTAEQNMEQANSLLGLLHQRLGPAWRDEWMQSVATVPHHMLPAVLGDDPEAAMRELEATVAAEVERLRREDPDRYRELEKAARQATGDAEQTTPPEQSPEMPPALQALLDELAAEGVEVNSQEDLERLLAERPELRARFEAAMNEAAPPFLHLLSRFIGAQSWDESQRIVEANPDLLSDEADAALAQMIDVASTQGDENAVRILEEHRALLRRCREIGIAAAFAEHASKRGSGRGGVSVPPQFREDLQRAQQGVQRYRQTGDRDGLDAAAAAWSRILEHPDFQASDDRFRLAALNNSGGVFLRRYRAGGRVEDLNRALTSWERAVKMTPPDSPDRPSLLNNLGTGLSDRYARTGRLADLEEAIRVYEEAVKSTPPDSPDRPSRLNNLGTGLRDRYNKMKESEDLAQARANYQQACELGLDVAPEAVITSGRSWGNWALRRKAWQEAVGAYGYAFEAIDQLLDAQLQRSGKEAWLKEVQGLPGAAAYAWARLGKLEQAVAILENKRTRLLAEALEAARTDLERLPDLGHEAEYDAYRNAVERLASLRQRLQNPPPEATRSARAELQRELKAAQADRQAAIAAIQAIEGYADFFKDVPFPRIAAAAGNAPLVYLLATPAGGLALIVDGGGVDAVWLGLTETELRKWLYGPADDPKLGGWFGAYAARRQNLDAWRKTMDDVTHLLWGRVMEPVAAALERLGHPPATHDEQAPLVTLVPTGLLALLPLHAAWTPDPARPTGRRYFLDDYAVRYAPSATGLARARGIADGVQGQALLAIDEPQPVQGNRLPNSRLEVAAIADLFPDRVVLPGGQATRQAMLDALPGKSVVHFSCHGFNNWDDPLKTGLVMAHDEPLTVRDLMALGGLDARLAALSACETGIVGRKLPDEVIAFPTALLQAGFAGVAASLWSVADESTAMLMIRFYRLWQEDGLEPVYALRAAQRWLRDTTNQERADYFDRFRPRVSSALRMPGEAAAGLYTKAMIHKEGLDARSFSHPFWWSAFYLTGV